MSLGSLVDFSRVRLHTLSSSDLFASPDNEDHVCMVTNHFDECGDRVCVYITGKETGQARIFDEDAMVMPVKVDTPATFVIGNKNS